MTETHFVHCPMCNRKQPLGGPDTIYWCENCRGQFDDHPDEGGDFHDRYVSGRIERDELSDFDILKPGAGKVATLKAKNAADALRRHAKRTGIGLNLLKRSGFTAKER